MKKRPIVVQFVGDASRLRDFAAESVASRLCPTCGTADSSFCSNSFHIQPRPLVVPKKPKRRRYCTACDKFSGHPAEKCPNRPVSRKFVEIKK